VGEKSTIRDAADAVKGVVEAVPIYQDLLQLTAKELGKGLQTVTKTVLIVLAPFEITVWGYESIKKFISAEIPKRLRNVPNEKIISPNPSVAGPTIEALRFAANEPVLRELYANLLATSMDADRAQNAHPAFVQIISQMVPDEARIVDLIASEEPVNISHISGVHHGVVPLYGYLEPLNITRYVYLARRSQCELPDLIPSYLDNLRRLGVTQHDADGWHSVWIRPDGRIDHYKESTMSLSAPASSSSMNKMIMSLLEKELSSYKGTNTGFSVLSEEVELTAFGRQFADACVVTTGSN